MTRELIRSPRARLRLDGAAAWLRSRPRTEPILVVGPTREAAAELIRTVTLTDGARLGVRPATLACLAADLSAAALARAGVVPASPVAVEAVCARVVADLAGTGGLGRFEAVAELPGLPRALSRTMLELRGAGLDLTRLPPDIRTLARRYEERLDVGRLADRPLVLFTATEALRAGAPVPASVLLLDVPVTSRLEADLVHALADRSTSIFATVVSEDGASERRMAEALGLPPEDLRPEPVGALTRLQHFLFEDEPPAKADLGDEVVLMSAPGESREATEIVRRIHREAALGVPFDRMAILVRAGSAYTSHLEEALHRAGVPAHFDRGTRRPDTAGRAVLALLACRSDGLSARRFAEYLSLGEVPDADDDGAPPAVVPAPERFVATDHELTRPVAEGVDDEDEWDAWDDEADDGVPEEGPDSAGEAPDALHRPVVFGTLRVPHRWEQLLVDAAVIGGLDRWRRRLDGLDEKLKLDLAAADPESVKAHVVARRVDELANLRRFALPLLEELAALPDEATWGEWLLRIGDLATRAVREPDRVLALLAELAPMAETGPVGLTEVRMVLARRLTEIVSRPRGRRYGRVFVAPVESARGRSFDVVFAPGLSERVFPQKVVEDPVLLDAQRSALGPDLERNPDRVAAERTALRLVVGAAERRIYFSWSRVDVEQARPRVPSFYGLEVMRAAEGALPGFDALERRADQVGAARLGWPSPDDPRDAVDEAEHDLALLGAVLRRREDEAVGTARYLLQVNPYLERSLRTRARRWNLPGWSVSDGLIAPPSGKRSHRVVDGARPTAVAALAEHQLPQRSFSATALQNFASCPYRFLLRTIHRLAPREVPEPIEYIDPLSRGSLIHDVQFHLLTELRQAGKLPVDAQTLDFARERLDVHLDTIAARFEDKLAPAIDRVWQDGIAGIRADLQEWLRRMTEDVEWVPHRFELAFGLAGRGYEGDEFSRDEPVELPGGLKLRGAIDLVERRRDGTLRVTDYKTGRARVAQGAVIKGGEALQPVFYALAAEALFPDSPVSGGTLYYCTTRGGFQTTVVPLDFVARRYAEEVVTIVDGHLQKAFLPAAPGEGACRWCDYRTVCGPHEELRTSRKDPRGITSLIQLRERA